MADGIVFIHAFPLDASMWAPQVAEFGERTTVLAPNLPGFGGEPARGDVMTMSAAAEHVFDAARGAGVERAVVCGLSMGGYVALALWRQHPELVSGLVLANTRAEADDEAGKERRRQLAERLRSEGNDFLVENPPPLLSDEADGELITLVKNIIAAQPAEAIAAAALGMAERPNSTGDLAGITVPTLVITSSKDTLIPPDATRPLADGVANARYEVIDGAGHLSNLQAPREFNRLLREHLDRVAESGPA
ncbi:MAG: alpha/beta fold hydrolase [Dehalococcoidia bacterium]|nr:alpha/beta fold hydrolase [Dehalococcoidia bacterium]